MTWRAVAWLVFLGFFLSGWSWAQGESGGSLADDLQGQIEALESIVSWSQELETTVSELQTKLASLEKESQLSAEEFQKLKNLLDAQQERVAVLLERSKNLLRISESYRNESRIWKATTFVFGGTTICFGVLWLIASL